MSNFINTNSLIITAGGGVKIDNKEINNIDNVNDDNTPENKTLYTKKKIDNECVKNNTTQTLINTFIMSNSDNEMTIKNLSIKSNYVNFNSNNIYVGNIIFGFSKIITSYQDKNNIRTIYSFGYCILYDNYIIVNAGNVESGLSSSESTTINNPLCLIYVNIPNQSKYYGNTKSITGYNSGPIICYRDSTNPYCASLEMANLSYPYVSKIIYHYNYTDYNSNFSNLSTFTFNNTIFYKIT